MRNQLTILLTFFSFSLMFAQDFELIPYRLKNKWGFSDSNKKIQIKPKFQDVIPFNYGFAAYKENEKWGIINITGKKMMEAKFDSISGYFQKYITGKDGDNQIDILGLKVFRNGQGHFVDVNGKTFGYEPETIQIVADESASDYIEIVQKNNLYGFINTDNNNSTSALYYDVTVTDIGILAKRKHKGAEYNLVIDPQTLELIIAGEHQSIKPTIDMQGFYVVNKDGKMGYFDRTGEPKISFRYEDIIKYPYSNLVFMVRPGKTLYGYLDLGSTPKKLIQPKYLSIGKFINGYAKVKTKDGKYGYINYDENEFFKK